MRKADYALLARLIESEIAHAARNADCGTLGSGYFAGCNYALHQIARNFADGASVDTAEFLKACGIKSN
jgi:hypothetical protein